MRYLLILLVLAPACALFEFEEAPLPEVETLTIMTYNVEDMDTGGKNATNLLAYQGIASLIKGENVELVFFQEIQAGSSKFDTYLDGSTASWGDTLYFNQALANLDYPLPYYGFSSHGGARRDFIAAFSKYPLSRITSIDPERLLDPCNNVWYTPPRPVLRVLLEIAGARLWFYSMHLKSNAGGVDEMNAGLRRAQAFHLMRYLMRNHDPETDLIAILGDMNSMPEDYDGSGNSTLDYLCLRYDNPWNTKNDFIPVNLVEIGAVTNFEGDHWGNTAPGTTHPGNPSKIGYPDASFDHIILSPSLYHRHYLPGSIEIIQVADGYNGGYSDHFPLKLTLQFTNFGD